MTDYGLLAALPVTFFVALGLLVVSIVATLRDARSSPVRLGLHVVALVLMLHGTIPIVVSEPNYPWVYKHIGVTDYVNLHGSVKSSIDIYQSWPGFFAAAAWFTKLAGVGSPLAYAAWAPVYFNLLSVLMLGFVFRSLPVARRTCWLAVFVFVAGNWVGQDYFSPQAFTFVLSLAVLGMVLAWLQVDRPPALVRALGRRARRVICAPRWSRASDARADPAPARTRGADRARPLPQPAPSHQSLVGVAGSAPPRGLQATRLAVLFVVFAAVVISHQLSPYMIIIGVTCLVLAGKVRPRWVALVLAVEALAYLIPNLSFLQRTQDLFGSLLQPFGNIGLNHVDQSTPETGHRILSLAAPALVLGLWGLAALGVVRRLRAGRPTLLLAALAASPLLLALVQSYGGEAVLRIYLFSLPWTALLAASALAPRARTWSSAASAKVGVVLAGIVALFMSAFYGSEELYRVQPGALAASEYFYAHAEPGSVLILGAPQFPLLASGNYDQFVTPSAAPNLVSDKALTHRQLGRSSTDAVSAFADSYATGHHVFLALTADQQAYAQVLGLLPPGSLATLAAALAHAPQWRAFYTNGTATIYQYVGRLASQPPGERHQGGPQTGSQPSAERPPVGARLPGRDGPGFGGGLGSLRSGGLADLAAASRRGSRPVAAPAPPGRSPPSLLRGSEQPALGLLPDTLVAASLFPDPLTSGSRLEP